MLRGEICCPSGLRLLDIFNNANSVRQTIKADFLEFDNAYEPDKEAVDPERHRIYIRKDSILLLAISEANKGRGIGALSNYRAFPFIRKTALPVSLQMQNFCITGCLHLSQGQTSQELLNGDKQFLPLTKATVGNEQQELGTWPVVIVNKNHLIWLWENQTGIIDVKPFPT